MAKKGSKKKKSKKAEKFNPKWELFCRYYTQNQALFGNATLCYAEAYSYKLDELSEVAVYETNEKDEEVKVEDSEYVKAYNVCSVEGARLLRTPRIQARLTKLLNELLKDEIVDAQLAKTIMQDRKLDSKIAAIREYNKLRQRITDKLDLKGDLHIAFDSAFEKVKKNK